MSPSSEFVVALLGARMNYAVPRILHRHGRLAQFYTDICASRGWPRILSAIPRRVLPSGLRRLAGRRPPEVPVQRTTAFTQFGLQYQRKRSQAQSVAELTAVHNWAGKQFGELILEAQDPGQTALFCFNTAGLELLQAWRARGLPTFMEQTIAPREVEEAVIGKECEAFPDWQEPIEPSEAVCACMERERREWDFSDVIVCGSDFVKEGIGRCGGPKGRCVVVPYGVDLSTFPGAVREPVRSRPLRVLTVGQIGLRKGSQYVLGAARALKGFVDFRMVGSFAVRPGVTAQLQESLECIGNVPRKEVAEHFKWADVFLLPSLCEGSATVTYEALSTGLPLVVTRSTGSLVEDGVDGIVVAERSVEAIVEALNSFLRNPEQLSTMSNAALQKAQKGSLSAYDQRLWECVQDAGRSTALSA